MAFQCLCYSFKSTHNPHPRRTMLLVLFVKKQSLFGMFILNVFSLLYIGSMLVLLADR